MKKGFIFIMAVVLFACSKSSTTGTFGTAMSSVGINTTSKYFYDNDTFMFNSNSTITEYNKGKTHTFTIGYTTGTYTGYPSGVMVIDINRNFYIDSTFSPIPKIFSDLADTCYFYKDATSGAEKIIHSPFNTWPVQGTLIQLN